MHPDPESPAPFRGRPQTLHDRLEQLTPRAWVTQVLLAINLAVFIAMAVLGVHPMTPDVADLVAWGANWGVRTTSGEWWRLVTCMFVHVGLIHLAFNMWALLNVGPFVERLVGNSGYLVLYMVSGVIASLVSTWWDPWVTSAGASGALFGLIGGLLGILTRRPRGLPVEALRQMRNSLLGFVGINVFLGFSIPQIDMSAHLGGLVAGFVCGLALGRPSLLEGARGRLQRDALVAAGGALVIAGLVAVVPKGLAGVAEASEQFIASERQCIEAYDELVRQGRTDEMSDAEFAALCERDVLEPWRAAREELESVEGRERRYVKTLIEYARRREFGWELMVEGVRAGDERKFQRGLAEHESALKTYEE